MNEIIRIKNLSKSFGDIKAVRDLSFEVRKGELFAFLGVNGAGKSTTISIMCGTLSKDEGEVLVCGKNVDTDMSEISKTIGVVFQSSVLDSSLSVYENLRCRANLYGIKRKEFEARVDELAKMLDFEPLLKRIVGKLSGGQRRRIDIARAILHHPRILVLDEPTTGLDPQTRRLLWDVVQRMRTQEGMTVFLTTHYMEEAAEADYVVILDSGVVAAKGTPLELKNTYTGDHITVYGDNAEKAKEFGFPYTEVRDGVKITVPNTSAVTELIVRHPEVFDDFEVTKGKMDDVFLTVTGKKLTEEV